MKKKKSKKLHPVVKILLIIACTVGALVIAMCGINIYMSVSANQYIHTDRSELPHNVDAIIVPGAGLTTDNKPSLVLQDRLDTAIELYESGVSDRILMSGDHGDDYHNEVRVMKDYAVEHGVRADDVFMDHAGFNTYDTMVRAEAVFQVHSCVIVTQTYHLIRSVYIARRVGLDACGYPSEIHIREIRFVPLEMREFLARVKAFFYVMIKPDPEYLGDPIPISGSGSQTD